MELQVVLIGAVVFVVSAVLIYLISAFTMKEKTFEEVIAEQRRQQELELQKAKQDKKSDKDVRKRFKNKKEKTKGESPKASEPEQKEHKMVNLELEPEIIEPVEDKPLKAKKNKPTKPILHNKDEKTPIISDKNVEEMIHRGPTPKDDLEMKITQDKKTKKDKSKKQEAEPKQPKPIVEEIIRMTETRIQAAAPPSVDVKTSVKDKPDAANMKLISSVKSATLNDSEVQSIIDILLNKQGGSKASLSADWSKKSQKGDPVALLKRQLEEKERSLQEEQQMVMAANSKLKEIRQQLNQENMKFQAMEKSYKDKVDYQNREITALTSRIQHSHDQSMQETNQLRAKVQQLEAAGDQRIQQRLADENKILRESLAKTQSESISAADANNLKQKVAIMEKELGNNALKLNTSENTRKTMEVKFNKAEAELKKLGSQQSSNENVVSKRVDEISQELRKSEAKNTTLTGDLQKAETAVNTTHKEVVALKAKLQELEKSLKDSDQYTRKMEDQLKEAGTHKIDIEGNMKNLQKRIENFDNDKSDMMTQIQALKQENNNLVTEMKTSKERQQGEGQEAPSKVPVGAPNGVHEETKNSVTIVEHEKILSEKTVQITHLSKEVETRKSEFLLIQQELEAQKKKNNELREKNWKAMDALEKTEKSVSDKVKSAISENREELVASQTELETYDKTVMQRLFPDITVKSKKSHKDWMSDFEKQVSSHLSTHKQQQSSSDNSAKLESRIQELESSSAELKKRVGEAEETRDSLQSSLEESESTCSKLQSQIAQYRNVLGETENKLTQLENSVEAEESKWQEKLQAKQTQLQQAQEELSSLSQQSSQSTGEDEMKERVSDLEGQLKESEGRCMQLQTQVTETETRITEYKVKIVEIEKSSASVKELDTDLEELRRQLEAEKKKNKELATNVVKYKGIVKTGHDALTQEQQLVETLRQQLAGGDNSKTPTLPNNSNSEVNKLKQLLAEREKQLEQESNSNKHLTERLAASQGSIHEAGTSV